MAFDGHKNLAYSTVATAPSPATSGTSLVLSAGDGTKFPTVPFNAVIWPAGVQPSTSNAEIVRVTAVSTDTLTIIRAQESTSARTVIVNDQIAAGVTVKNVTDIETTVADSVFDFVASGCVWSGDAYASTRNASMTSGTIVLAGVPLTAATVTARTFTASKDTYIDASDNLDGTILLTYTEVSNNAASPALTAGSVRIGIIVTGVSTIASVAAVNQGQETKLLPIASSTPYTVTDSLGNLICPRDSNRQVLGYRFTTTSFSTTASSDTQVTALSAPVIVPTGRKVKITVTSEGSANSTTAYANPSIWEGTVGSGTRLRFIRNWASTATRNNTAMLSVVRTPATSSVTYNAGLYAEGGGTATLTAGSDSPAEILIELL